jgi:hypothetical protein
MNILRTMIGSIGRCTRDPNFQDAGKVPGLSTFSGLTRVFRGIGRIFVKPIDEKVHNIGVERFKDPSRIGTRTEYPHEKKDHQVINGLKDIGRGLVEMVPILGNVAMVLFDSYKDRNIDRYDLL